MTPSFRPAARIRPRGLRTARALTLALDRYEGSKNLSKIAIVRDVAGVQVPGTPYATPPAELEKLAGYGRDVNANRAEARRLLKEAGVPYTCEILIGPIAASLADCAESRGCDAIVMGSHGHGAVGSLVLGSIATKVLHLAKVPVFLVK